MQKLYEKTFPNSSKMNYVGKIWIFIGRIKKDDLIVLPLKTQSAIAIGKSIGDKVKNLSKQLVSKQKK